MSMREIKWEQDKKAIHDILYNSGSAVSKKSYSYIGMMHALKMKSYGEICEQGFYIVNKGKKHWRLIEIAVAKQYQRKGIGRLLLFRMLSQMKNNGVELLTFRTPINEEAQFFWDKMGAKIVGLKENDYEMQIRIKL